MNINRSSDLKGKHYLILAIKRKPSGSQLRNLSGALTPKEFFQQLKKHEIQQIYALYILAETKAYNSVGANKWIEGHLTHIVGKGTHWGLSHWRWITKKNSALGSDQKNDEY